MKNKYDFRILIIDDNPEIQQDFLKILTPIKLNAEITNLDEKLFGESKHNKPQLPLLQIDLASQGPEGLMLVKKAQKEHKPYAVAFVDIRMPPSWDGIQTIKEIFKVDKNIQIVICTAYSDYTWEETITELKQNNLLILKKPFDKVEVKQLTYFLTSKWQAANPPKK